MELHDLKSPETIEFIEALDKLTRLIEKAFSERTPHLKGEKYLNTKNVIDFLKINPRLLNDYRTNGIIPYIKISGKILYKESDVISLLERHHVDHL